MARLPGIEDLGPAPRVDPARPIADISAGGAALAQAGEQLGKGIAKLGEGAGELALDRNRWDYAKAHSFLLTGISDRDAATAADTNYGPDESGKSLPNRHADQISSLRDQAAGMIADPAMRERFLIQAGPTMQRSLERGTAHAKGLENNASIAWVANQGDNTINLGIKAPDEETRASLLDGQNQLIDGLVQKGAIQPTQAVAMKHDFAHHYATADYLHAVNSNDPAQIEAAISRLRSEPGSPADITGRILQIEGTGKNARSSAQGAGQFTDETWVNILKQKRPDLADGRSDPELLALRADRGLARDMTEANRADNQAYLEKRGIAATPGAQYLAHFLGPAGAAAVLKADPNKPIADVLAQAVGKTKAAAMIEANPEILTGKLAGSVAQWADTKMGGGHIHEVLRIKPDEREQLIAHGEAALQKYNVTDLAGFKTRIEDTTAEAMRTGGVTKPIERGEFISKLGAENGGKAYEQYNQNIQLGRDVEALKRLDPQETTALLKSYEPQPGAANYAESTKRYDALGKAVQKLNEEKAADPAGLAVARLPASGEAYKTLNTVLANPMASEDDKRSAARDYANRTLMEQGRVGVPADQQRVVPADYAERFSKAITSAADSDEPQKRVGLIGQIQREAAMWGEHWPAVMRQLADKTQPIVRAIAAGADVTAMTRLLSLGKDENPKMLLKEQNETKAKDLDTALNTELAPFLRTLVGRQKDRDYTGYFNLAEKLGALYVRDGKSASDAARDAFNDLIGKRYEFRDTWRLPKSSGVTADDVQAGTQAARNTIADAAGKPLQFAFGIQPAADDIGLREGNHADSLQKFARDGVFVTAPDNGGLNLVYGDKAVRRTDGAPVYFSWADLARLGGSKEGRTGALTQGLRETGAAIQ